MTKQIALPITGRRVCQRRVILAKSPNHNPLLLPFVRTRIKESTGSVPSSKVPWCFNTKQAQNGISRPFRACGAVDAALRQRNFRMNRELSGEPRWNRTLLGVSFEIVDGARLLALRACFTAAYGKVPMLSSAPGSSRIPPGLGDILETRGVLNP
jgi:hypothetical protein